MFGAVLAISKGHTRLSASSQSIAFPRIFKQCFCQNMLQLKQPVQRIENFSSWRSYVPSNRTWSYTLRASNRISNRQICKAKPNISQFFRNSNTNPLNVNTKVVNNVMLYKYERPWLFKGAFVFGVVAMIACLTMADNIYLIFCKDLFNSEITLKQRLIDNVFSITAMSVGIIAGPVIFFFVWYIIKRSVKYVVLHKGGETVTFINYHPIKGEARMTVPANWISSKSGRHDKGGYIPVKIKTLKNHLILDKGGKFINPELFDCVVATRRFD